MQRLLEVDSPFNALITPGEKPFHPPTHELYEMSLTHNGDAANCTLHWLCAVLTSETKLMLSCLPVAITVYVIAIKTLGALSRENFHNAEQNP